MRLLNRIGTMTLAVALACAVIVTCGQLSACAPTTGTVDIGGQQAYNNRAAQVVTGVTKLRQTATAMLRAGKITSAQDEFLQYRLDAVIEAIDSARSLYSTDPAGAQAKLDAAATSLAGITTNITGEPPK